MKGVEGMSDSDLFQIRGRHRSHLIVLIGVCVAKAVVGAGAVGVCCHVSTLSMSLTFRRNYLRDARGLPLGCYGFYVREWISEFVRGRAERRAFGNRHAVRPSLELHACFDRALHLGFAEFARTGIELRGLVPLPLRPTCRGVDVHHRRRLLSCAGKFHE